jgi:hypothetical protein
LSAPQKPHKRNKEFIMTTESKIQWGLRLTAGMAILAIAAGCASQNDGLEHGERFVSSDREASVQAFNKMESASAARADATLRTYHFDGASLNSLGEERLDLILRKGDSTNPLVLYLDLPADDSRTAKRQATVTAYLKDHGLTEDQIALKSGPNPDVNSPVGPLLAPPTASAASAGAAGGASASGGH